MPIARLLAMAFRSLIDDLHKRLDDEGYEQVRRSYGPVLLALRQQAMAIGDVGTLMGTTKQAASKLIENMESDGFVNRIADPADARGRRVALSRRGHQVLEAVERIYLELEAEWAKVIGRARVEALRSDLTEVLRGRQAPRQSRPESPVDQ